MQARTPRQYDEPLEALAEIRRDEDELILIVFLDGSGRRHAMRLGERAAVDLHDALDELLQD